MTSWWIVVCALALAQTVLVNSSNAPTSQLVNDKNNSGILDVDAVGGEGNIVESDDENNLNSPHVHYGGSSGGDSKARAAVGAKRILPAPWSGNNNNPSDQTVNSDGNSGIESIDSVGGTNNYVKSHDHNDLNSLHIGRPASKPAPLPAQLPAKLPAAAPLPAILPSPRPLPGWGGWGPGRWVARYEFNPTYQQLNSVNNRGIEDLDATGGTGNSVNSKDSNSLNSPRSFLSLDGGDQRNPTDQDVNDSSNSGIVDADAVGGTENTIKSNDENNLNSPRSGSPLPRPQPLSLLSQSEGPSILPIVPPVWWWGRSSTVNPTRQRINSNANRGIEDIDATGGRGNRITSKDSNNLNSPSSGHSWLQDDEPILVGRPVILPWPRPWSPSSNNPTSQVVNSNNNSGVIDADATGGEGNVVISDDENNLNSPHSSGDKKSGGKKSGGISASLKGNLDGLRIRPHRSGSNPTRQVINANNNSGILDADATGGEGNSIASDDANYLNSPHS